MRIERTYEPDPTHKAAYDEAFARYRRHSLQRAAQGG